MNDLYRNTRVEIDLDALRDNISALRKYIFKGIKLAPVIKANAYGHGAAAIAAELEMMNVEYLAVAIISEALELRVSGVKSPVLVMGYTEDPFLKMAVAEDISLTIFEYKQAKIISAAALSLNKTAKVHIKVDTGFNRLGKKLSAEFAEEIIAISKLPALSVEGLFSHLRLADEDSDAEQFDYFTDFADSLKEQELDIKCLHICDSIGAVKYKEYALDMIRPGAIIYGYVPKSQIGLIDVKPIMTFKSRITRVEKLNKGEGVGYSDEYKAEEGTLIATVAAGYADGYSRHLSGKGFVTIRGEKAKVVGIICMDQMMVDVTQIPDAKQGDDVVLFGSGENETSVEEMASLIKTNKNDIISGISRRVPRVYFKNRKVVEVKDYLMDSRR